MQVQSLGWEDPLEWEMATHSSSCLENPMNDYSPHGRKRVEHDLATKQQQLYIYIIYIYNIYMVFLCIEKGLYWG